jgi:hypothetical protein
VAIDDHSRIAFSRTSPVEKWRSVIAFLHVALAYYARLGIRFKAILTDNGFTYRSISPPWLRFSDQMVLQQASSLFQFCNRSAR